jgi:hypothetical protein
MAALLLGNTRKGLKRAKAPISAKMTNNEMTSLKNFMV